MITDPVRLSLVRALLELRIASAAELSRHSHTSDRSVRRHLEALVALGLAHRVEGMCDGLTTGRPAERFTLEPAAQEQTAALFELLSEPFGTAPR